MTARAEWPPALAGSPAVAVIENAIARDRLSHSLLLHGEDQPVLVQLAHAIADRLLNTPQSTAAFPPEQHPDCFALRPSGKLRQIGADATRELIGKVQVSATVATRKVAIVHEADRMNLAAANIFLKTLEEPPANTTLVLLTARPYALLPTIRSRVLHFRFPSTLARVDFAGWPAWLNDYRAWLGRFEAGIGDKQAAAEQIFGAYGLVARFSAVLDAATGEAWKIEKEKLPADIEEDEQVAIETGLANGLRLRLFAAIEEATRDYAQPRLAAGDASARTALIGAVDRLEHAVGLLRLNLNVATALEDFMLNSLRLWAKR
jgi:DNA polymerase-3 subunit delta'